MQTQSLARRDCLASRRTRSDTGVLAWGPETSKLRSCVLGRGHLSLLICVLTWTELHQGWSMMAWDWNYGGPGVCLTEIEYCFIIVIITTTISIVVTFIQVVHNYVPETNHVSIVHTYSCSCSVFTVCATCHVISHVKYVLYLYISTSRSVQCPIWLFSVAP
jgi:hypothetical protein